MANTFYTDNMTVNEILSLGDDVLSSLSKRDMQRAVRTVALAANKRVNRLLKYAKKEHGKYVEKKTAPKAIALDALNAIGEGKKGTPKFGVKGKETRNELYKELSEMRSFMHMKTSKVTGATTVRKERERRYFTKTREEAIKNIKDKKTRNAIIERFRNASSETFRIFRELLEDPSFDRTMQGYEQLIEVIGKRVVNGEDSNEILKEAQKAAEELYIANQDARMDILTDDPFEINDDDDEWW